MRARLLGALSSEVERSLGMGEAGGSIPPGSTNKLNFEGLKPLFISWIEKKDISKDYKAKLLNSFRKLNFSIYKNPEKINTETELKLFYNIVRFFEEKRIITSEQATNLRKIAHKPKSTPDNYIPTVEEIKHTINKLPKQHKIIYLALLYSGLRITEIDYLIKNIQNIKKQEFRKEGFVKYSLNWKRGKKSAYFAYLPYPISQKLAKARIKAESLSDYIKKHNLLPAKYLRKFFYTKGLEIGIPSEVLDFYQGRSSKSIGAKHYLAKSVLADKYYLRIMQKLDFLLYKCDNIAKPYQAYPISYS